LWYNYYNIVRDPSGNSAEESLDFNYLLQEIHMNQQYYPEKNIIIIKQLFEGTHWKEYNDHAEKLIQGVVSRFFNLDVGLRTVGYSPEYDYRLGGRKIEQKISAHRGLELEYAREDGRPSGLSLTESDYYLTLSPSGSKHNEGWVDVGKIRIFKTSDLFRILGTDPDSSPYKKVYKKKDGSPGARVLSFTENDLKEPIGTLGAKGNQLNIALLEVKLILGPHRYGRKREVLGYDLNHPEFCGNSEGWLKHYTTSLFK